ncbi:MAG: hypothetical protein IT348_09055 [Candidatus Eisenbacteria bacterium]|nr:hypothetical protein [Candidatus Eisenbacteria bacterium]
MTRRHDLRLFDDFVRTDMEFANRTEEGFDWWNRFARADVAAMRDELEYWFGRYCPNDAHRLRREFRSSRRPQHVAALFELFIHENLLKLGFTVECQVALATSANVPDFLVFANGQPSFYVEAKAKLESTKEVVAERRKQEVLEAVRHMRSPDFFVSVTMYGTPSTSINKSSLVRKLTQWLANLDHDHEVVRRARDPYASGPTFTWPEVAEGFSFEFRAYPRGDSRGREFGAFLASEMDGHARLEPTDRMIADAVEKKGGKYAGLSLPYLIAIDLMDFTTDADDVELGLLEAWGTDAAPKGQLVSGVLLANVPNMSAAVAHIPHLVLNPMAEHPLGEHAAAFTPFTSHLRTRLTAPTP